MDGSAVDAATIAPAGAARPLTGSARIVVALDRGIYRIATHWLLAVTALFAAYALSLALAPALVAGGHVGAARPIYAFHGLFCHQRADRSFHLFGEQLAVCERCTAIYVALLLAAVGYAFGGARLPRPRSIDLAALGLPILVDGLAQLAGLWESTAATRVLTGSLLGIGIAWLALPYLESGCTTMRARIEELFARLVATGRARPL